MLDVLQVHDFHNASRCDTNPQVTTSALAASLRGSSGSEVDADAVALRDLWGGYVVLEASPNAAMMVTSNAQHQALTARQPRPAAATIAPLRLVTTSTAGTVGLPATPRL